MEDTSAAGIASEEIVKPTDLSSDGTVEKPAQGAEEADTDKGENESEDKRLSGWQRKKLQNERLKNERDFWRDEALKNRTEKVEKPAVKTEGSERPKRPRMEEFDGSPGKTWEDFHSAEDKYIEEMVDFKANQVLARGQQQTEQQKVESQFAKQVDAARKLYADFDEFAFSEDVTISDPVRDALISSENGALLAYELGKHPEEVERLAKLPLLAQVRELGKIEARIAPQKSTESDSEESAPTSRAPAPPNPTRKPSGGAKPFNPLDHTTYTDFADFEKKMEAYEKRH